jgi:hypothetical protein
MNVQITCKCGYHSRGERQAVVRDLQEHCQQAHSTQVDPARIEANVVPMESLQQTRVSARPETPSSSAAQFAGIGLQVAALVAEVVARRAQRPTTARIAGLVGQQLKTVVTRSSSVGTISAASTPADPVTQGPTLEQPAQTAAGPASAPPAPPAANVNESQLAMMKLQRKQQEDLIALRGIEGAINQMSNVKLGIGH